jgi:hypothetical protein
MAIDLEMDIRGKIRTHQLVDGTKKVLRKLLGIDPPQIRLHQMVNGERTKPQDDALGECDALYLLSFVGRTDEVAITVVLLEDKDQISLSIAVGATRAASEYALAIAAALFVGAEYETEIRDGFMFWTGRGADKPDELCEVLKVGETVDSFDQACQLLLGTRAA